MKNLPLALAIITMIGLGTAAADPVDPANVTTFQSGTPALAGEVNSTMQALITAIDDNASRIAAMETSQASLVPGDISGNIYCFFSLNAAVGASDPDPVTGDGTWAGAAAGRFFGQLTFTSPTQATLDVTADDIREVVMPSNRMLDAGGPLGSEAVTWTLVGNMLTLTYLDASQDVMFVTPDANIVLFNIAETERSSDNTGDWFYAELAIGMRASSCN